jgi:hypothetical protein
MPSRKTHQKPPPGLIFMEDYTDENGNVLVPGIATRLGISVSTYKKWRMAGAGPMTTKHGKRVVARVDVVDAYVAEIGRTPAAA